MKIIDSKTGLEVRVAQQSIDANKVKMFLNRVAPQMPEVVPLINNPQALNAISVLFQSFANNIERIGPLFQQFKSFLAAYDQTPSGAASGSMSGSTTSQIAPVH